MYPDSSRTLRLLGLGVITTAAFALTACHGGGASSNGSGDDPVKLEPPVEPEAVVAPSTKGRVKFKGPERWGNQLARGLGLQRDELCKELSNFDCLEDAHRIALGGVEPYRLIINEPLPIPPVTAPIAADRVALSACSARAERDLANPTNALIYDALPEGAAPDEQALHAMGRKLYRRLLSRDPQDDELEELVAFWALIADDTTDHARDWATMTCYAVATSVESLFY
ncbi:MAG: hypothetical protein AAGI01_11180 [Myxococcota bacterium]